MAAVVLMGVVLLGLWVVLTVRAIGWGRLRAVAEWPGARTLQVVRRGLERRMSPVQRRRVAVRAELAIARFHCWRHGVNTKNPR